MIKNIWAVTKVYCDNHSNPLLMQFKTGPHSLFYACPEHDNKYKGKIACPNRISIDDLEALLEVLSQKIETEEADGGTINLTGWKFRHKYINCRVIRYEPNDIHLAITNGRAFW